MTDNVVRLEDVERAFRNRMNESLGGGLGAAAMALAAANLRDREQLPDSLDVLVGELANTRNALTSLRQYEERITNAILEQRPSKNFTAAGLSCEIRGGKDRKAWDSAGLLRELLKVARKENRSVDLGTGEVTAQMPDDEALMHVIESCARPEWRVTALRGKGLDPDDWCETSPGRRTVTFLD